MPELLQPPQTTVVTGGAGWFGQALLHALADTESIWHRPGALRVLVHQEADEARVLALAPQATVTVGDIADERAVRSLFDGLTGSIDVIHAAGVIHPKKVSDFERINSGGTRLMVETAERHGVRRFVHVSSNSPFGTNPKPDEFFRNDEPYSPYLGYGLSKMHAELHVKAAQDRGRWRP
ncbi:MAG: NAD-dependent epimerase/dehydratase family protein [Ilumatobacteraceae bacterium]